MEKPLDEAIKLLEKLQEHAGDRMETHTLSIEARRIHTHTHTHTHSHTHTHDTLFILLHGKAHFPLFIGKALLHVGIHTPSPSRLPPPPGPPAPPPPPRPTIPGDEPRPPCVMKDAALEKP